MPGPKAFNVKTVFTADETVTRTMRKIGKGAGSVAKAGAKVTAVSGAAIFAIGRVAATYQKSMNRVEALTGASADQMQRLGDQAKKLGRETQFSASQAADAMGFLGMAGYSVNDILAATPDLLNLAAAANIDLARAADIASNIMGAFGKNASETGAVADILARATASANVDMEMLAETMKDAAPIAKQFGASLKDTSVLAGFLGNIGIQGSKAGTAMKNIFLTLSAPPAKALKWFDQLGIKTTEIGKDGENVLRPVKDSFKDLGGELAKLPAPTRLEAIKDIFGKIPIASAAALANDLGKTNSQFVKLTEKMNDGTITAEGMAKTMNKGASGSFARMASAAEGVAIAMGESGILKGTESVFNIFAKIFSLLGKHAPILTKIIGIVFALAGVITAVAGAIVLATKLYMLFARAITIVKGAMVIFNFIASMNPISLIVIAVAALVTGFIILADHVGGIGNAFKVLGQAILQFVLSPINLLIAGIVELLKLASLIPGVGEQFGNAGKSLEGFQDSINQKLFGTTSLNPFSSFTNAIIKGDGSTPPAPESENKNTVDINVKDGTREDKTVTAKSTGKVNLKLSPAT